MEIKRHPCHSILPKRPKHVPTKEEKRELEEWLAAVEKHGETTISIHEIIQKFHVDIGKVAELIVTSAIPIKGFMTGKSILTFPDNIETKNIHDRVNLIIAELRVLLASAKQFKDTISIDFTILDVLDECFFDRGQFLAAFVGDETDPESEASSASNDPKNVEDVIKKIQIAVENDETLKIKRPGGSFECFTRDSLGFGKSPKEWKILVDIVSINPPFFQVGPSSDKNRYNALHKYKNRITQKLIQFFNTFFSMGIPKDFKFFELDKDKGNGTYRLKLRTCVDNTNDEEFKRISDDLLMSMINRLQDDLVTQPSNDIIRNRFWEAIRHAMTRGLMTKEDAKTKYNEVNKLDREKDLAAKDFARKMDQERRPLP